MIALQPIIDQLKASGLHNPDGVLEFASLKSLPRNLPAQYVVPRSETAGADRFAQTVGAIDQAITEQFEVYSIIAVTARSAGATQEALKVETDSVKAALTGWTHPEATGETIYRSGTRVDLDAQAIVWVSVFEVKTRFRKT